MGQGGAGVITVCFHGAESTGKSVLAERLRQRFGWPWVPEYGREYCEEHGTNLTMADLLAIAEGQAEVTAAAHGAVGAERLEVLILDTDQLMTAAWAQMLFGTVPDALLAYPKADLYMVFLADVPWVADSTRFFGESNERARFAALAEAVLARAEVPFERISGDWDSREAQVIDAIHRVNRMVK